jgi:hypothetical protein
VQRTEEQRAEDEHVEDAVERFHIKTVYIKTVLTPSRFTASCVSGCATPPRECRIHPMSDFAGAVIVNDVNR